MPDQLSALEALQHENAALRQRVAELEEIEQHVRESEATYRALFDNMEDGISLHEVIPYDAEDGVNFRILDANPAFERQTGLTAADLRGPAGREIVSRMNPQSLQLLNQVALTGEPVDVEYYSNKFQRHFHLRAFSLQPDRFAISVQDITARQQAAEALRQSEAKYRLLFENMQEGFSLHEIICDDTGRVIDFRFLEANAAYEQHTGLKPQAIVGKTMLEIMPQADRRQIERYGRVALTGEPLTFEYYSKTFNRHVRVRAFCPEHGRFATIFEDITARKQMEDTLRDSEASLNAIFNATDEAIYLVKADHTLLALNAVATQRLGRPSADLLGRNIDDLLPPEVAARRRPYINHALTTGAPLTFEDDRNGRWMVNHLSPILNESGHAVRLVVYSRDITARKQREDDLRQLNATLEQRVTDRTTDLQAANVRLTDLDRLKDEFLSRISHELRTPLAGLIIALDLLEVSKPEKRERYMARLKEAAERLQRLIEDILLFSQLSRQLDDARPDWLTINDWLEGRLAGWQQRCAERGLALQLDLADDLPAARADADLMLQILNRLLTNALSYTPAGSVTLTTGLCEADHQSWVTISVADTGPGITADDLPHLFERFYRGRAAADFKTPGAGIGLSISRDIAERLGGRLTVETELGVGSTFTVWLRAA